MPMADRYLGDFGADMIHVAAPVTGYSWEDIAQFGEEGCHRLYRGRLSYHRVRTDCQVVNDLNSLYSDKVTVESGWQDCGVWRGCNQQDAREGGDSQDVPSQSLEANCRGGDYALVG